MSDQKLVKSLLNKKADTKPVDTKKVELVKPQPEKKAKGPTMLSKAIKVMQTKTVLDVCLFAATLYVIYEYGKDIAKVVEDVVPTE